MEVGAREPAGRRRLLCCVTAVVLAGLLAGLAVLLLARTSVAHTYLRTQIWRDFSINKTLPDGAAWDLSQPAIYGLPGSTSTLAIPVSSSATLGAWWMEPEERQDKPAVLYLHGIAQTRGYEHRVGLYRTLLAAGYPVLAVDYRGFGDSTDIKDIREETVVEDAKAALGYLRKELGEARVVVWGHSQGAAIAAHMVAGERAGGGVEGLVLESPYGSLAGMVASTTGWGLRLGIGIVGLDRVDMELKTAHWLLRVKCPVLILHAEDDPKIPAVLSERMFNETVDIKSDVSRILMDKTFGYGHNDIYQFPRLADIVSLLWTNRIDTKSLTVRCTQDNVDNLCALRSDQ